VSQKRALSSFLLIKDPRPNARWETVLSRKNLASIPEQYKRSLDELHDSLNTIIQILSKVDDKTWRRKLAGMCLLALGMLEFPETNLQETPEEEENYIG